MRRDDERRVAFRQGVRGGPRADDIAIRVAQCLERMGRDFQAKNLELFGEVGFSLLECRWRGRRMPFSDQRTEMPVIHNLAGTLSSLDRAAVHLSRTAPKGEGAVRRSWSSRARSGG